MELSSSQKRQRIWLEFKDMCASVAFPLMMQIILSTTIILYADYSKDTAIQVFALLAGEVMLMAAYIVFGRQNGISAYRNTVVTEKKRMLNTTDVKAYYKTGEYALWKGAVIGLLSVVPFMLFAFINCLAPNLVCEVVIKYGFGWAAYPFIVIGQIPSVGKLSGWLDFIWVVIPVAIHTAAYYWGGCVERKKQEIVAQAQEIKDKHRK